MEFKIPKTRGIVCKSRGHYYLQKFPLCYDSQGNEVYWKGESFKTKEELLKKREALVEARSKGEYLTYYRQYSLESKVFIDYLIEYQQNKKATERTKYEYIRIIEYNLRPYFKNITIEKLGLGFIQFFIDQSGVSDEILKKIKVILNKPLDRLYKAEAISKDYARLLDYPRLRSRPQNEKQPLSKTQVQQFLSVTDTKRLGFLVRLMFDTGLRSQEALALTWDDIKILDESTGIVNVNKAQKWTPEGYITGTTKTIESKRHVAFYDKKLVRMLLQAKANRKGKHLALNRYGTQLVRQDAFNKHYFVETSKTLKLPFVVTSHHARMNFITHALLSGKITEKDAQTLSGHSDSRMTQRYNKRCEEVSLERIKRLDLYSTEDEVTDGLLKDNIESLNISILGEDNISNMSDSEDNYREIGNTSLNLKTTDEEIVNYNNSDKDVVQQLLACCTNVVPSNDKNRSKQKKTDTEASCKVLQFKPLHRIG